MNQLEYTNKRNLVCFIQNLSSELEQARHDKRKSTYSSLLKKMTDSLQIERINQLNICQELDNYETIELFAPSSSTTLVRCSICNFIFPSIIEFSKELYQNRQLQYTPSFSPVWRKDRLTKAFDTIGLEKNNPFIYDNCNHDSIYFLPINFLLFDNGLHSGSVGIIKKEGLVSPTEVYDISPLYDHISFDGTYFIHRKCGTPIFIPYYKESGYLFEAGRIAKKFNLF